MTKSNINLFLAFVAGLLTTLSPCVLPVIPFVTASSLSRSRFGPVALAGGILVTFVGVSLAIQATGSVLGIGPEVLRLIAGVFLTIGGLLLVSQTIAGRFAALLSSAMGRVPTAPCSVGNPIVSEFFNGFFLGVVWTPCSGPSLGVALGLAGQAGQFGKAALVLSVFGIGAITPLIIFAYGARRLSKAIRNQTGVIVMVKKVFGLLIMLFGILIITGYDRNIEAFLNQMLPDSWLALITQY